MQPPSEHVMNPFKEDQGYKPLIEHALPQAPASGSSGPPQSRGIRRTDITEEN